MQGPFEFLIDLIHNEPYLVTLAIDSDGASQKSLDFNFAHYPQVRPKDTVEMLGNGHLVYGPKNPGSFVAVSVLVMESDHDMREFGDALTTVVKSKVADLGLSAILATNPGAMVLVNILKELTALIAQGLAKDKDDPLMRTSGVFLRDMLVPYEVNRKFTRSNEYVDLDLQVVPLKKSNGQGPTTESLSVR